eukprot:13913542-Alexandrium_andersonii.AAC.1
MADQALAHVPKFAIGKAKTALKELEKLDKEVRAKLAEDDPAPLSTSLQAVADTTSEARVSLSLLE